MRKTERIFHLVLVIVFQVFIFSCNNSADIERNDVLSFVSFRDIPGVTSDEIAAIEEIKSKKDSFLYGMPLSIEAFENENNEIRGYSALFCEWLTEFFGISFQPVLLEWLDLLEGLESREISFTGELTAREERLSVYSMTSAIASRPLKYFRLEGSKTIADIIKERPLKCGFIEGTATAHTVSRGLEAGTFETVMLSDVSLVYDALKSGQIDIFYYTGTVEVNFIKYSDMTSNYFYPLTYRSVSLSTQNPDYKPIISVVEKALQNRSIRRYLAELYNSGYQEYLNYKLFVNLTEEERLYIQSRPVIPVAFESSNYPVSFFNVREGQWQGIAFDVLYEVEKITGLRFQRVNDEKALWSDLLKMLEEGKVSILTELMYTKERENVFLWSDTVFMNTYFSLITRLDHQNITLSEIFHLRIGLIKDYAHTEYFRQWFPDHLYTIEYESNIAAFEALERNEVDAVMASSHELLLLTHYLEKPGFKVNFLFEYNFNSALVFYGGDKVLFSVVNKALRQIDVKGITDQWMGKTFDYRSKLVEAQRPLLIGSSGLLLCILFLVASLFIRSRRAGKVLEEVVEKRTHDLELQTSMLMTIFNSSPDFIFCKDLNLRYTRCNESTKGFFNGCMENIIGKTDEEIFLLSPQTAEEFLREDRKVIDEKRPFVFEESVKQYPGYENEFFAETIKAPLIQNGDVIGIMGIARDITKRKEMERMMAANYEYSNRLNGSLSKITKSPTISSGFLKAASDIIAKEGCLALNATRVSVWSAAEESEALENISCFDACEGKLIVKNNIDLSNSELYAKLLKSERMIVTNNIKEAGYIISYGDYSHNLISALDAPIRIDGKLAGVVCAEQDKSGNFSDKREWITEEQNFVSSLADLMALAISSSERYKAQAMAETASKTKSNFLANMSHEIRTPMNSIVGFSELALDGETSPKTRDYLAKILENAEGLLQIINDVLDISKVESGKMELEYIPFDLHELFKSCQVLIMPKALEKGIILHFYTEPFLGKMPLGDPTRLRQVLVNLLSNAVKFTNTGVIKLLADIIKKDEKSVTVRFEVKDSGIGMTEEQIAVIFEPFTQAEAGITRKYGGTGLGLAITKNIVEMMGGDLQVDSVPGIGSKFSFELTFETAEISEEEMIDKNTVFKEHEKPLFEGEVLLCEDNPMNQQVICEHLARVGLKSVVADNGMIGVELVQNRMKNGEKQFDLILMDIHMPVMDGIEASGKIITLDPNVPIVAMTANIMTNDRDIYRKNGMQDCVGKPFTSQELWRCLMKYFKPVTWQPTEENLIMQAEKEFRYKLIEGFLKESKTRYAEIVKAIEEGDITLAHRMAHTLKGNSGQLGKTLLQQAASVVELNLKDGSNNVTGEQMAVLEKELNTALMQLAEENEKNFKEVKTPLENSLQLEPLDALSALELLERLNPLLKMGNPECIDLINELRRIPGSEKLIQQMEDFDFQYALKTLAELNEKIEYNKTITEVK